MNIKLTQKIRLYPYYYLKSVIFLFVVLASLTFQVSAQTQTARDYFEQGLRLLKEQNYEAALAAFRESARLEPKQPATHNNIGGALLSLRRETEAVAAFREAVRLAPNEPTFRIGLCESLSLSKNHAEAVTQCEEAVRLGADLPTSHLALVAALRTAKRNGDALQTVSNALSKFAENEGLLNFAAELYLEAGNIARSTEIYETLARLKPGTVFYQIRLAENYLRLERDVDAIAAAQKALALEQHPLAYFFLGRVYLELGQNEEAAQAFQKSSQLNPKSAEAFYFLGLAESRRGKAEGAIAALRQAVALSPDTFEYHKELASNYTNNARLEEAIASFRKAVKLKPDDFEAKVGLGVALFESAQYEEGLSFLMEADRMKPGNQFVNMFLNVARARQQGMAQIDDMKRFAKENPKDLKVRVGLIQLLGFGRRLAEAEPYIEEVLQMNPKNAGIYLEIAVVYSTVGKEDKALAMYRKALEIEQNPGAYLGLAGYYTKLGQVEEALKAYAKVLELKPDSPNIMKGYADLLRDNGKRREALEMYKRSLEMLPLNPPALFNAGLLSAKFGDLNAAQQYLATLKSVDPQTAKTLARYIKMLQ